MASKPTYQELEKQVAKLKRQVEISQVNFSNQNEQIYHSLFENMALGFARCEMLYQNDEPIDFIYLEVNNAFEKLTGLKNVVGKTISEILPNHIIENQELFNLYIKVSNTGIPEKTETYVPQLQKWFFISAYSLRIGQFLVIFKDIGERKKSEEELRASEAQFRGLFTQSHIGTAIVGLDKCFIRVNRAFCHFLGYSENEILGKKIADFTHPEDLGIGMNEMKQIIEDEMEFATLQKRYLRKNGDVVWGELTISIVRDEQNKPLYFLPVIHDITERYNAVQTIKENEIKLKESNALKDKLFSIIAHDLRSPFNNIMGFTKLLIENTKDFGDPKFTKYLEIINSTASNTIVLLDNLLSWAKSESGQIYFNPENQILSFIIKEVFELSNSVAQKKNIVLNYFESEEIVVFADQNMILTILRNLISNAIKFTNSYGKIDVYASQVDRFIEIAVSDNGVGIDEDTQKKLFNLTTIKSTQGTANEKGTGLGLILCKDFVEKHGGIIWVESILGKGSTFKFKLPLQN